MDFSTPVHIPRTDIPITHSDRILLLGSCFSEHIGNRLSMNKFNVDLNPFGILFNPVSISRTLRRLWSGKPFSETDLVYHRGLYHSLMHHGQFSDPVKKVCLQKISDRFLPANALIGQPAVYMITFGTAYVYRWKENGEIVGNCHQIPADRFTRERLTVEEIVKEWEEIISLIKNDNPGSNFLFTVSPVRHLKDGAHDNQLSKSILHLAIDHLQQRFPDNVCYFPAYEVMMDELRDYRFYDNDMTHPSSQAAEYIWERFSETFFSEETRRINQEWSTIRSGLTHRPLHPETDHYNAFLTDLSRKLEAFSARYPGIQCDSEKSLLQSKQKQS